MSSHRLPIALVVLACLVSSPARPAAASAAPMSEAQRARHVLDRLAFGPRPGDLERVQAEGVGRYIDEQLDPGRIEEPIALQQALSTLTTLQMSPSQLADRFLPPRGNKDPEVDRTFRRRANGVQAEVEKARLMRAIESPRQLQEVMVDFWFNHFNVYRNKGLTRLWMGSYEEQAIRPHVLGRFRDLVGAVAKHPAMVVYLDNGQNIWAGRKRPRFGKTRGINENFARELMELHTLGVDGGYTQADVVSLARILTGWRLKRPVPHEPRGYEFAFDKGQHDPGLKMLLNQPFVGSDQAEGEQALDLLCRQPATAHHIAFQLAQAFVADVPPEALVNRLSARFLETDGDIHLVLGTLFHSSEFWEPRAQRAKFKTPYQYVVSAVRASGQSVQNYPLLVGTLRGFGQPLYGCLTPDGYKNTEDAWLSPDALTRRLGFAVALASGRFNLIPGQRLPVDADTLSRTLGNDFSSRTRAALRQEKQRPLRAALILGSPEFMRR